MRPILEVLSNHRDYSNAELYVLIADIFALTPEERSQRLPSGRQPFIDNRVGWALFHLKTAGLVESPRRGMHRITMRGEQILHENLERVDLRVLDQFPEHVAMRTRVRGDGVEISSGNGAALPKEILTTPEETIALAYQELRSTLAQELIDKIKQAPPDFFERLVVDLLLAMGYGGSQRDAGETLGRSGDGGIDGVIREDRLGLDVIYIQAKRWEGVVGRPTIQGFVGAIHGARASKGVIITTSDFTVEAREYVKTIPTRIVLVNGKTLAELMIDHNVGVSRASNFEIKKVDNDYFLEL